MADRLVSVDSVTHRFPVAVREQLASEAEDLATELGAAVDRAAQRVAPTNGDVATMVTDAGPTKTALNNAYVAVGSIVVNVIDFGAKGDSTTDDTAAIQAALDAAPGGTVVFPRGIYAISQPLSPQPRTVLKGLGSDAFYPNFTTDWQVAVPSWGYQCSTIQYIAGAHGAIFTGGGYCTFESLVLRCGQARTTSDVVFLNSPSHIRFSHNIVQNMATVHDDNGGAWGAWHMEGNTFMGCGGVLSGSLLDFRIVNNTFTSMAGLAISMTTGGGLNVIEGNRFEWGEAPAIKLIAGSRHNIINSNLFDAHATVAIEIDDTSDVNTFTGNLFWRNGRNMTNDYQDAHILLKAATGQVFVGNVFKQGGPDSGTAWNGPKSSVSLDSLLNHKNTFRGNNFRDGSKTSMVFSDRYNTSVNCVDIDSVDIPAGASPGVAGDDFAAAAQRISAIAAGPLSVFVHEDRFITSYVNIPNIIVRGAKGTSRSLSNSGGSLNAAAGVAGITYGGLAYSMMGGDVYASAVPNGYRNNGGWAVGRRIYNSAPAAGGTIGWVIVASGSPDTWKSFGTISA